MVKNKIQFKISLVLRHDCQALRGVIRNLGMGSLPFPGLGQSSITARLS